MIYFDGQHLMADTLKELHLKAVSIGLQEKWFQPHPRHPHYDVWGAPAQRLTVNCTAKEMLRRRAELQGQSDDNRLPSLASLPLRVKGWNPLAESRRIDRANAQQVGRGSDK